MYRGGSILEQLAAVRGVRQGPTNMVPPLLKPYLFGLGLGLFAMPGKRVQTRIRQQRGEELDAASYECELTLKTRA